MKYLLTLTLVLSSLTIAQDELPGWGVYVGGGLGGMTMEEDEGVTMGYEPALPFIGVSKGLELGVPLIVGVGLGKRSYNMEMDFYGYKITQKVAFDYIDVSAYMPYPVGPGAAMVGFLFGSPLQTGKATMEMDGESEEEDIEDADMDPDYGLVLGYSFPVGDKIAINAGYYLGLADHGDSDTGAMKFNGLFCTVGYSF